MTLRHRVGESLTKHIFNWGFPHCTVPSYGKGHLHAQYEIQDNNKITPVPPRLPVTIWSEKEEGWGTVTPKAPRAACSRTGLKILFPEHQLRPEFITDKGLQSYDLRRLKTTQKNGALSSYTDENTAEKKAGVRGENLTKGKLGFNRQHNTTISYERCEA